MSLLLPLSFHTTFFLGFCFSTSCRARERGDESWNVVQRFKTFSFPGFRLDRASWIQSRDLRRHLQISIFFLFLSLSLVLFLNKNEEKEEERMSLFFLLTILFLILCILFSFTCFTFVVVFLKSLSFKSRNRLGADRYFDRKKENTI